MLVAQVDLAQAAQDMLSTVLSVIPTVLVFLAILIVGYFVAKVLARALDAVLGRIGFDRMVERGGIRRALERTEYEASDVLSRIVFYAIMLLVLQMAFGVFGPNPVSDLIAGIIAFLPQLFVAVVILVIATVVGSAVADIVSASLSGLSYGRVLGRISHAAIVVIGVFAALNQLQIAPAVVNGLFYALLAIIAGSAIVAIGGGGIAPMREQWERALGRVEAEAPHVREEAAREEAGPPGGPTAADRRAEPSTRGEPTLSAEAESVPGPERRRSRRH